MRFRNYTCIKILINSALSAFNSFTLKNINLKMFSSAAIQEGIMITALPQTYSFFKEVTQ